MLSGLVLVISHPGDNLGIHTWHVLACIVYDGLVSYESPFSWWNRLQYDRGEAIRHTLNFARVLFYRFFPFFYLFNRNPRYPLPSGVCLNSDYCPILP